MLSEETRLKLFDTALQYKRTRLWERLADQQIFAVAMPDGQTAYCCVMGLRGEYVALGVYVGQKGVSTYCDLQETADDAVYDDDFFTRLPLRNQDCTHCIFGSAADMDPADVRQAKQLAARLHVKLTEPFPYPYFLRFTPMHRSAPLSSGQDAEYMMVCLRAAVALSRSVKYGAFSPVPMSRGAGSTVPLLTENPDGSFSTSTTRIPPRLPLEDMQPRPLDEFTLKRLRRCRPCGRWEGAIYVHDVTIADCPDLLPSGPVAIYADSGRTVPVSPVGDYDRDADRLYREFAESLINLRIRPSSLTAHSLDRRGQAFFGLLARQLRIPFETDDFLPDLSAALDGMQSLRHSDLSEEQTGGIIQELCRTVLKTPLQELAAVPDAGNIFAPMVNYDHPAITPEVREKLFALIDRLN